MMNPARGAASDFALGQLPVQQADATAQALGQAWTTGLNLTQSLGSQYGNFALQEAGAGSRFGEGSGATLAQQSQTENVIMQAEARKKEKWMSFAGDMISAFAGPLTGGLSSILGGGGGGATRDAGYGVGTVMTTSPAPSWTPAIVPPPTFGGSTPLMPVWGQNTGLVQ